MKDLTITEALRDIVAKFGHNILLCPKTYDILLKTGVFDHYPSSYKNIIKFIFEEGMIESINFDYYLSIYPSQDDLIENLVENYGYNPYLVREIVGSIFDSIISIPQKDSFRSLKIIYDGLIDDRGKLVRVPEDDGWVLITKKGKELRCFSDEDFIISDNFVNGYVCALKENKWGIIDINANYITPLEYDSKSKCDEMIQNLPPIDFERVLDDCLLEPIQLQDEYGRRYYGLKNIETQEIHHFFKTFDQPFVLHYGLKSIVVSKYGIGVEGRNQKFGFINKRGEFVIDPIYKSAQDFERGPNTIVKADNGLYGKINILGDYLINPEYECLFSPFYFHESLMPAQRNKKWGFVDDRGNCIIDFQFKNVYSFKNGYAPVKNFNNKWGYIDRNGKITIPFEYDEGNYFEKLENGRILALVKQKGRYSFIDKKGKPLTKRYIQATEFEYGYAVVSKIANYNEKWGIINENEETIFPFIIDDINPCGFMESEGNITLNVLIGSAYLLLDMNSLSLRLSTEWNNN